jgi:chromosome segregation ATPase
MLEERQETVHEQQGTPRWMVLAVVTLAAVSLLGLGVAWSANNHEKSSEVSAANENKALRQDLDVLNQRLAQEESANAQLQGDLNVVTDHMKITQGELSAARRAADKIKQDDAKQLSDMQDAVNTQLATKATADDVKAVSGSVDGVRTDLSAANDRWNASSTELGTQIAKNHDEVEQLRRMGQRDYFEFTVANKGGRQKLGDVTLELRGTNVKHNQYTVDLYVDDMKLEKRDRSVNEPIFFYTKGSRASMELVVNQVGKDKIVGYLSVPKVQQAANASSGGY